MDFKMNKIDSTKHFSSCCVNSNEHKQKYAIDFISYFLKSQQGHLPFWKTFNPITPFASETKPMKKWKKINETLAVAVTAKILKYLPTKSYSMAKLALLDVSKTYGKWYHRLVSAIWHRFFGDGKWLSTAQRATRLYEEIVTKERHFQEESQDIPIVIPSKTEDALGNLKEETKKTSSPSDEEQTVDKEQTAEANQPTNAEIDIKEVSKTDDVDIQQMANDKSVEEITQSLQNPAIVYLKGMGTYHAQLQEKKGEMIRDSQELCGEILAGLWSLILQNLPIAAEGWKKNGSRYELQLEENKEKIATFMVGSKKINIICSSPCFFTFEGTQEKPVVKIEGIKVKYGISIAMTSIAYDTKTEFLEVTREQFALERFLPFIKNKSKLKKVPLKRLFPEMLNVLELLSWK